jgi:agmatine deiminase
MPAGGPPAYRDLDRLAPQREDWPGKFAPIAWVYAEIVRHLSQVEGVHILVNDDSAQNRIYRILLRAGANLARLHFHQWQTDRVWLRDSGPIFVKNPSGDLAVTNWKFNAWAKYDNWRRDDQIPQHVAKHYDIPQFKPEVNADPEDAKAKPHRLVLPGAASQLTAQAPLTTEEVSSQKLERTRLGDEAATASTSRTGS